MHSGRISGTLSSSRAFGDYDFKQYRALPQWQQQVIAVPSTRVLERIAADQFLLIGCDGLPDIIRNDDDPTCRSCLLQQHCAVADAARAPRVWRNYCCVSSFHTCRIDVEEQLATVCSRIVDTALEAQCMDNLTLILVCIPGH